MASFVLGGLNGNPLVQHFLYRHGVGNKEAAVQQFFLDRDFTLLRLLFGLETFPSLAGFTQAPSLSERSTAA